MPFTIIRQDITKLNVDAIVNAANPALQMGGGVCGAIFKAAGPDKLNRACQKLAPIQTGQAVITPGFKLPAKNIIHTAGPIYQDGQHNEAALLRACYVNSLQLAVKARCRSIAFPLISSGIYGYPKAEALQIATSAIEEFLRQNELDVYLVVFDRDAVAISERLHGEIQQYIDQHYVDRFPHDSALDSAWHEILPIVGAATTLDDLDLPEFSRTQRRPCAPAATPSTAPSYSPIIAGAIRGPINAEPEGLEAKLKNLDESFSMALLRIIDQKGKTDVEVYKKANLDRRLFSKIRSGRGYVPSKKTVLALAVALELTQGETEQLLRKAGFALSNNQLFDVIIQYFLEKRIFNIFEINEVLFSYDQPLLGG